MVKARSRRMSRVNASHTRLRMVGASAIDFMSGAQAANSSWPK